MPDLLARHQFFVGQFPCSAAVPEQQLFDVVLPFAGTASSHVLQRIGGDRASNPNNCRDCKQVLRRVPAKDACVISSVILTRALA
jgi:hypothetical protein